MRIYRLLKDLPTFKAGDIFELRTDGLWLIEQSEYENHWKPEVMAYHINTLKNFPNILEEWFEEIKPVSTTKSELEEFRKLVNELKELLNETKE